MSDAPYPTDASVEAAYDAVIKHIREHDSGCLTIEAMRAAIIAAEQAAWRPFEEASNDIEYLLYLPPTLVYTPAIEVELAGSTRGGWRHGRATKFRPLPASPVSCVPSNACETGEGEG